jgi:hypothetical protein
MLSTPRDAIFKLVNTENQPNGKEKKELFSLRPFQHGLYNL